MSTHLSKDEIIRAVLDTTFYKSAGATSLADIASRLNVKKASLYNHFSSREELISETMISCEEYVKEISFIPNDVDSVAKKYSPEIVLKGIVNRYFKMHEKTPLFQIYTFLESQKHFSAKAAEITALQRKKLVSETIRVLQALCNENKLSIKPELINSAAIWFCAGVHDLLDTYLIERKKIVINNPESGEGELFTLTPDENAYNEIDLFIQKFVQLLN